MPRNCRVLLKKTLDTSSAGRVGKGKPQQRIERRLDCFDHRMTVTFPRKDVVCQRLTSNRFLLGLNGAVVLYYFFVHEMALLVEALNILLNGIWSVLEVGPIRLNLHGFDSIAVPKSMILTNFSKIQGWRNTFNFKLSIKERLPSKTSAVLRFHLAVQPIKDVFVSLFLT